MYSLVYVEPRYIAPFAVLLWTGIASAALYRSDSLEADKLVSCVVGTMVALVMITVVASTISAALKGPDSPDSLDLHRQVANGLQSAGIQPREDVGFIGYSFGAYWAQLARVRIVADIPREEADKFWVVSPTVRARALSAFCGVKVRAVVTDHVPVSGSAEGWERIGKTNYYAFALSPICETASHSAEMAEGTTRLDKSGGCYSPH